MFGLKNDEMLICFLLIIVGYCIAKMFSRRCEGFSVGVSTYKPIWLEQGGIGGCYYGCKGELGGRCPGKVYDCNTNPRPGVPNGYVCKKNNIFGIPLPDSCDYNPNAIQN